MICVITEYKVGMLFAQCCRSFWPNVAISLQCPAIVIICRLLSVCLSSVTRMYCHKKAEVRIVQFSLKCSPMPSVPAKFDDKIRRGPSIWGAQSRLGGFRLRDAIFRNGNGVR